MVVVRHRSGQAAREKQVLGQFVGAVLPRRAVSGILFVGGSVVAPSLCRSSARRHFLIERTRRRFYNGSICQFSCTGNLILYHFNLFPSAPCLRIFMGASEKSFKKMGCYILLKCLFPSLVAPMNLNSLVIPLNLSSSHLDPLPCPLSRVRILLSHHSSHEGSLPCPSSP